ncbi:formin homolog 6 [Tasmannia lanceolata]|uniref:formin homolog 6 n=1 Tax=Tasmannia lanceolata TaxID=3420 RepID=UPI004063B9E0
MNLKLKTHFFPFIVLISVLLSFHFIIKHSKSNSTGGNRRILHQPLFPISSNPPPTFPPPPPQNPISDWPFFPQAPPNSNPDQQTQSQTSPPTSNVTSSSSINPPGSQTNSPTKKLTITITVTIATLVLLSALAFFLCRLRRKNSPAESQKLVNPNNNNSQQFESNSAPANDLLYLGTMDPEPSNPHRRGGDSIPISSPYHRLSSVRGADLHRPSPELQPLPPLNGAPARPVPRRSSPPVVSSESSSGDTPYYSPQGSIAGTSESSRNSVAATTPTVIKSIVHSSNSTPCSRRTSPKSRLSNSPVEKQASTTSPPPLPSQHIEESPMPQYTQPKTPSPPKRKAKLPSPPSPPTNLLLSPSISIPYPKAGKSSGPPPPPHLGKGSGPPPPPPPPPTMGGSIRPFKTHVSPTPFRSLPKPQSLIPSLMEVRQDKLPENIVEVSSGSSSLEPLNVVDNMDDEKPRLKPLHWDKVRASSDRATVWDQLKSSSFQLNEDMIETLFCNSTNPVQKEATRIPVHPSVEHENRVLDPKKSQNIAILLRALNVTRDEVTEALLDGNPEGLGAELLETLIKMAPTKEEEFKLRDYNGDISKLGSAERFLKAVLDIPFAFKRVDAMLYRANFDAEVKYLRKSFETLEVACEELRNSRLFLKLLEAVLRTGNRMNVGTNRGEAKAFKLDTLLKLADVKGTDGKTTLLHFVVQEIIRSQGSSSDNKPIEDLKNKGKVEEEFKRQGLQLVSGLSRELSNVKKSAGMDSDVLHSYVSKLEMGLEKINLVLHYEKSNTQGKFFEAMKVFLHKAQVEIIQVKVEEEKALSHVKEITEYFHGDTAKEEAHPFRIFMVVRDFLSVLDQVCKEVGKMQDGIMVGSARSFRISSTASLPVLHRFNRRKDESSDEDSSSST